MLVHRFVGLSEIEALVKDGFVRPLPEHGRRCLYFFDSNEHASPDYQLEYLSGIVGEIYLKKTEQHIYCLINCEIEDEKFLRACGTYADPEGSFWATIGVEELHLFGKYKKDEVKTITIYVSHHFGFKRQEDFNSIEDAYEFLKSKDAHEA